MGDSTSEKEMIKISIEEFSRLQDYMMEVEKDSTAYKTMKRRYIELKIFTIFRRKSHRIRYNQRVTQPNKSTINRV